MKLRLFGAGNKPGTGPDAEREGGMKKHLLAAEARRDSDIKTERKIVLQAIFLSKLWTGEMRRKGFCFVILFIRHNTAEG